MTDPAKKTQLERYGVIALLVIFAFTLSGSLRGKGARRTSQAKPTVQTQQEPGSKSLPTMFQDHWKQLEQQVDRLQAKATPAARSAGIPRYTAHELRDPLKSLLPGVPSQPQGPSADRMSASGSASASSESPPARPSAFTVQGVFWGGPRPSAIINGEVYGLGATVDGATITSIGRDGVEVEVGGSKVHLTTVPGSERHAGSQAAHWEGR